MLSNIAIEASCSVWGKRCITVPSAESPVISEAPKSNRRTLPR